MDNKTLNKILVKNWKGLEEFFTIDKFYDNKLVINWSHFVDKTIGNYYKDIILIGLDELEDTYGDFDAIHKDEDKEFNQSVVTEIIKIRKQIRFNSLDLTNPFTCNVLNIAIDYFTESYLCDEDAERLSLKEQGNLVDASARLQYVVQYFWGVKISAHLIKKIKEIK